MNRLHAISPNVYKQICIAKEKRLSADSVRRHFCFLCNSERFLFLTIPRSTVKSLLKESTFPGMSTRQCLWAQQQSLGERAGEATHRCKRTRLVFRVSVWDRLRQLKVSHEQTQTHRCSSGWIRWDEVCQDDTGHQECSAVQQRDDRTRLTTLLYRIEISSFGCDVSSRCLSALNVTALLGQLEGRAVLSFNSRLNVRTGVRVHVIYMNRLLCKLFVGSDGDLFLRSVFVVSISITCTQQTGWANHSFIITVHNKGRI